MGFGFSVWAGFLGWWVMDGVLCCWVVGFAVRRLLVWDWVGVGFCG